MCDPAPFAKQSVLRPQPGQRPHRAWWLAALLLGSVVLGIGCNPMQAAYFLVPNHNHPAEEFSFTEKKRNPKIAILVSHAGAHTLTSTDLFDADRELAQRLNKMLAKFYKDNRESVQLISPYK